MFDEAEAMEDPQEALRFLEEEMLRPALERGAAGALPRADVSTCAGCNSPQYTSPPKCSRSGSGRGRMGA